MERIERGAITYLGMTFGEKKWSEITGIPIAVLSKRKLRGWDPNRIFETPIRRYERKGRSEELHDADMEGQPEETVESG